jgi:hypothetical protein
LEKYTWAKPEVIFAMYEFDSEKVDDLVQSHTIAKDSDTANSLVVRFCAHSERVCMFVTDGSRPLCYFYETLFRKLGMCLSLSSFEMDLLNVIQAAPTQLHPNA